MTTPTLRATVAPRLPDVPPVYDAQSETQFRRVLNLYFAQLDNVSRALLGVAGGQYLNLPSGTFSSRATQSVSAINTPTLVAFDTTDYANSVSLVLGDGLHVTQAGVYTVLFRLQLTNTDTQARDMSIWLRRNGVDVPFTASVITVDGTHGGQPGYNLASSSFLVTLQAGEYIEFWWSANDTRVQLAYLPPITVPFANPGATSVAASLTFASALVL